MKTNLFITIVTAGALFIQGCGSNASCALTDDERAAISSQHEKATGPVTDDPMHADWKAFAEAHYTEDAVLYPPNGPEVSGRDAIEAYMATWPPLTKFHVEDVKMDGTKEVTYILYSYDIGMQINDTTAVNETGRGIELWRKLDDGSWRCFADVWNTNMPLPQ